MVFSHTSVLQLDATLQTISRTQTETEQRQFFERYSSEHIVRQRNEHECAFYQLGMAQCSNHKSGKLIRLRCQDGWQAFPPRTAHTYAWYTYKAHIHPPTLSPLYSSPNTQMNVPTYMCTLQIFHPRQGGYLTPEMFQLVLQTKIDSQKANSCPLHRQEPLEDLQASLPPRPKSAMYEAPQDSRRATQPPKQIHNAQ